MPAHYHNTMWLEWISHDLWVVIAIDIRPDCRASTRYFAMYQLNLIGPEYKRIYMEKKKPKNVLGKNIDGVRDLF
jgi:hypothetical protein